MIACKGEEIEKSRTGKGRDGRDGSESFAVKVGRWGKKLWGKTKQTII